MPSYGHIEMTSTKDRLDRVSRILRIVAKLDKVAGRPLNQARIMTPPDLTLRASLPALNSVKKGLEAVMKSVSSRDNLIFIEKKGGSKIAAAIRKEALDGTKAVSYLVERVERISSHANELRGATGMGLLPASD